MGFRNVSFSREVFIEEDDFMEDPPSRFFRLAPGREIRLKDAYYITCVDVVKDPDSGKVVEVHCTYDPETRGGHLSGPPAGARHFPLGVRSPLPDRRSAHLRPSLPEPGSR